jgi:hypothetical protein
MQTTVLLPGMADASVTPDDAPKVTDAFRSKAFCHNTGLAADLIQRDLNAGLVYLPVEIKQTTANQIVNLLSRSRQRRRKQIFEERIGKVSKANNHCRF